MNQDLRVRTKEFALRIILMFTKLPNTEVARVLGRQVLRSGTSIGANYREAAYRARSDSEFVSKIGDCLKELEETGDWCDLLVESGTVPEGRMAPLQGETNELLAIFTTVSKNVKERNKREQE